MSRVSRKWTAEGRVLGRHLKLRPVDQRFCHRGNENGSCTKSRCITSTQLTGNGRPANQSGKGGLIVVMERPERSGNRSRCQKKEAELQWLCPEQKADTMILIKMIGSRPGHNLRGGRGLASKPQPFRSQSAAPAPNCSMQSRSIAPLADS
jgi:hypothetical protein